MIAGKRKIRDTALQTTRMIRLIVKVVGGSKGQKSTDRAKQQATNRPQQVKPRACRSALRLRTADSNCSREKSCKI